jgi:hypothetical protein
VNKYTFPFASVRTYKYRCRYRRRKNVIKIGHSSFLEVQNFEFLDKGSFRIPMKKIGTSQSEKEKKKLIQNAPKQYLT